MLCDVSGLLVWHYLRESAQPLGKHFVVVLAECWRTPINLELVTREFYRERDGFGLFAVWQRHVAHTSHEMTSTQTNNVHILSCWRDSSVSIVTFALTMRRSS